MIGRREMRLEEVWVSIPMPFLSPPYSHTSAIDQNCSPAAKVLTTPYCFPWDPTLANIEICDSCQVEPQPRGYKKQGFTSQRKGSLTGGTSMKLAHAKPSRIWVGAG